MRLVYMDPADLAENGRNWRVHGQLQTAALTDVLSEVGWAEACLYNERTKRLVDGHLRRKVALEQGAEKVPVLVGDWDEAQEAKILATLDPLGAMASADSAALADLLRDVSTNSEALQGMLAGLAEDAGVTQAEPAGGGGDDFDPQPAEEGPTRTKAGQLWAIGGKHRLFVGDCTAKENVERLMGGEVAAAVVTDPPYSSGGFTRGDRTADVATKYQQGGTAKAYADFSGDNRDQRAWIGWCERWLALWLQHARPGAVCAVWSDWRQLPALTDAIQGGGWVWRGIAVWDKTEAARPMYGRFRPQCEYLAWGSAGPLPLNDGRPAYPGVIQKAINNAEKEHITQKPLAVGEWSLSMVESGGLVADPYLGSGTTLIAAHRLCRRCYGCELSERYAGVVLRRAEAEGMACELVEG